MHKISLKRTSPPFGTQDFEMMPMVGWYDPSQLIQTAQQVATSTLFGRHADHRLIEAVTIGTNEIFDRSRVSDGPENEPFEYWFDYVADTGDGWDSTCAVAYHLSQPILEATTSKDVKVVTRAGRLLIFGGDEVYPTPSREEYKKRLKGPYEAVRANTSEPSPEVFAIPGNHDWYDSLVAFSRTFLTGRWFAGWKCRQQRSYFAVKLPWGWWLLGTDVQLGSDIDQPQIDYFKRAAAEMKPEDQIILCNAEPHWIFSKMYGTFDNELYNESNLNYLEDCVLQKRIEIMVAGDLHHYRRHEKAEENKSSLHKITAGGGGAFLHPTHGQDVSELDGGFHLKASFPDPHTSARLCWRNLLFPVLNYKFGILPAVLYVITAWTVKANVGGHGIKELGAVLKLTFSETLRNPMAAFWVVLLFLGIYLFTDTHSKTYRILAGTIHGLSHLAAVFFIGWGSAALSMHIPGYPLAFDDPAQLLISGLLIFVAGWVAGSVIMGLYLLVSLNVFKRHMNESFSSLAIPDWKNFLRFKLDAEGLTIYPIGLRRVPRRWKVAGDVLEPDDPEATLPELIEDPIRIPHKTPGQNNRQAAPAQMT